MKFFGVVTLAVLVALAAGQNHSVSFGFIEPYDIVLHKQYYVAKPRWRQTTTDITYPPKGIDGKEYITAVYVIDNAINGTGGYASIIAGGPGQNHVTIRLETQRGQGYNMLVEIYGR